MRLSHLVPATLVLAASTLAAHATPVTINFNGLGGGNGSTFTTYTESGFKVSATSGTWYVASGNGSLGDPSPDIVAQPSGTINVTDGGGLFDFDSLDLADFFAGGGAAKYLITGFSNGTSAYTQTGSLSTGSEAFATLTGTHPNTSITSFTIALSGNPYGINIDNIDVNTVPTVSAVPEPSTLALLGTGILGLAGMARRKFFNA